MGAKELCHTTAWMKKRQGIYSGLLIRKPTLSTGVFQICLIRNPDHGFTPGSTPDFAPGSEASSVSVSSNRNIEPIDFITSAS